MRQAIPPFHSRPEQLEVVDRVTFDALESRTLAGLIAPQQRVIRPLIAEPA